MKCEMNVFSASPLICRQRGMQTDKYMRQKEDFIFHEKDRKYARLSLANLPKAVVDPHTVQQNQWSEFHTDACILISEFLTPPLCVTRLIRLYYEHNLFFWATRTIKICAFGELRLLQHHWWGGHAWNSHIIKINTTTPFQSTSVVFFMNYPPGTV